MVEKFTFLSTAVLGIIIVSAVYLFYKLIEKLKIKVDKHFFYGLAPWLMVAVFVRVFEDAGIYPETFWTVTPGIEILFALIMIPVFLLGYWIKKKYNMPFWKSISIMGLIPLLIHIPFFRIVNLEGFLRIFIFFAIAIGVLGVIRHFVKMGLLNFWALSSHMVDASATFTALTYYAYSEKHVLPTFLIENFGGAWVMFPLKFLVIAGVLYVINKYSEDKNLKNFLVIVVMILGLAPGLRDAFRLLMGV